MEEQVLQQIMAELCELKLLYKTLVEKLVRVAEATPEEAEAVSADDGYADEEELLKMLKQPFLSTSYLFKWTRICEIKDINNRIKPIPQYIFALFSKLK